ncbi:MAG: hypothetical protein QXZ09_06415 [Candidatus Methanomethylicaceae archaeon]
MIGAPDYYALASLFLTVGTFLFIYYKRKDALLALSIAGIVLALAVLVSPGGDFVIAQFNLRVWGEWRLFRVTAMQLKILMTVSLIAGVFVINQMWKKLGVKGGT